MYKVTRAAWKKADWGRINNGESERFVKAEAIAPDDRDSSGSVMIALGTSLALKPDWKAGPVPQLAKTVRDNAHIVTRLSISPGAAILLRNALNEIIEEAGIEEAP